MEVLELLGVADIAISEPFSADAVEELGHWTVDGLRADGIAMSIARFLADALEAHTLSETDPAITAHIDSEHPIRKALRTHVSFLTTELRQYREVVEKLDQHAYKRMAEVQGGEWA